MANNAEASGRTCSLQNVRDETISAVSDICNQGVVVRNAVKSYGVRKHKCTVIDKLNMTVAKGSIYGLLGASGCGKTTLLSCIVGRRQFDAGRVSVFGDEPGSSNCGIPGPRVGYMPQELALDGDLTIKETMEYFGRLYRISPTYVASQTESLCKLLNLPPSNRFVKTLSGGQKRRVSFIVALFHEPDLLILDEPTVGVDPLLRRSIWDYLVDLSVNHGRTIIVTTHYIEEARQANTIGLMRSGRLLIEDSPANLLRNFGAPSLEDVFLKLCIRDVRSQSMKNAAKSNPTAAFSVSQNQQVIHQTINNRINSFDSSNQNLYTSTSLPTCNSNCKCMVVNEGDKRRNRNNYNLSAYRTGVLIRKNITQTFRSFLMFFMVFFLPSFQTILFCLAIGRDPSALKVAIVNEELDLRQNLVCNNTATANCSASMLSCRYLKSIHEMIEQVPYANLPDALEAASNNKVWGVIHFGKNFSSELENRHNAGGFINAETILGSQIGVSMDFSNQQIAVFLQSRLLFAFEDFASNFLGECGFEKAAASNPVTFLEPIFGNKNAFYTEFMAPGIIISVVFFMAVALTSGVFIMEKSHGLLDRSLVAGVHMVEVLIGHLVNQFTVMVGQTGLVFLCMLWVFQVPCLGSITLSVFMTLLQGLCGMSIGLLVSCSCDNEMSAIQLSLGIFFPTLLFSGIVWPIEGMSTYLRYLSYALPQTYAIEGLRSIFFRGWNIDMPVVYGGIFITLGWTISLLAMSLVVVRVRKYTG